MTINAFKWTKAKEQLLKDEYFPGLDPAMFVWKLFHIKVIPSNCMALRIVINKLSELKLRNKKGYDI